MTTTRDTDTTPEGAGGPSLDELLVEAWGSEDPVTAYEKLWALVENGNPTTPQEHQAYMCALMACATVSIWPSEDGRHTNEQVAL